MVFLLLDNRKMAMIRRLVMLLFAVPAAASVALHGSGTTNPSESKKKL